MNICIFEGKVCRYAHKEGGAFTCEAPSDGAMLCGGQNETPGRSNKGSDRIVSEGESRTRLSSYERTRAEVYATGNRWAIENFNATH